MTTHATRGVIYIHSSPRALCPHVEWAAGRALGRAVNFYWTEQPVLPGTLRTEFAWDGNEGMGAAIATALRGWEHLRYEVTEDATAVGDGGRWMHTPDLGVFYAQTDATGNVVVPENRIRSAMESAQGSFAEITEQLRVALGQAWDDELDVFRYAGDTAPVTWLHKVG